MSEITQLWGPFSEKRRSTIDQILGDREWGFIAMLQDGSVVHYALKFSGTKNKFYSQRSYDDISLQLRRSAIPCGLKKDALWEAERKYNAILLEEKAAAEPNRLFERNPMPRPMKGTVTDILKARIPPAEMAQITAYIIRRSKL